ncbi:MAG: hypothetical protein IK955_03865 [Clostridia bacterium]|nr:hypothetical protein [Clostridia bacterium]
MKDTIFKAIAIIVCVFLVTNAFSSGISKFAEAEKEIAAIKAEMESLSGGGIGIEGGMDSLFDEEEPGASTDGGSADGGATDGGATDGGATDGGATDGGATDGGAAQPQAKLSKSDFIKLLNEESAKAAKGSYKLTRSGEFTKAIDVGKATSALNSIIKGVDKNADLNSVVGGFIGVKKDPIKGTVTNGKGEGFDGKYMLKAMTLTDADVVAFQANESGTQYAIQIANCKTPNENSAIAHAMNDYITFAEVNKGISDSVGNAVVVEEANSTANYTQIAMVVTVSNGKITKIKYSYTLSAKLAIRLAVITANGTGEADIKGEFTDIKY